MTQTILYHHRTRGEKVEGVHIRSVANALRSDGYQVLLLSPPGVNPEEESEPSSSTIDQRGKFYGFFRRLLVGFANHAPEAFFELVEIFYNVIALTRVARCLRQQPVSWIYERYSLFMFATVWLARRKGIPIVLEVNDSAVRPRVRKLLFRRLATRIEHWVFTRCDGLVFVSSAFRDQITDAHGTLSRTIISPNAADVSRFDPECFDRTAVRERLRLGDKVVCGYLGAFIEWHGIHTFVEKLAPLLPEHPYLSLLLIGDGKTRQHTQNSLAMAGVDPQAVFTGNVSHQQVPELLCAMDFSVLPDSNTYGSPVKLFELMAMGVPVVAPDYGPIAEVISDGETGWLFPAGDMARCLDIVLSLTAVDISRVGNNARRYILAERQWRNNTRQLVSLYRTIEQETGAL